MMDLFICHTPLHLLISLMALQEMDCPEMPVIVAIEDAKGLHPLANTLFASTPAKLINLPGMASAKNGILQTLIMRSNAKFLLREYAESIDSMYFFHDLRPESQTLLNYAIKNKTYTQFILLEDGAALYEPAGLIPWSFIGKIKHKIAAGPSWKHSKQLGLHQKISEIRCFYPDLIRSNLRKKTIRKLPTATPKISSQQLSYQLHQETEKTTIAAIPFTAQFGEQRIINLLAEVLNYCDKTSTKPAFKLHPRDTLGIEILGKIITNPQFLPQQLPLEIIISTQPNIHSLIGFRTSALHITKALCPAVSVRHMDTRDTEEGMRWSNFLETIGIDSIHTSAAPPQLHDKRRHA